MKKLLGWTLVAIALSMSACAKKDDHKAVTVAGSIKVKENGVGYQTALPTGTGYIEGEIGRIFAQQAFGDQFNTSARAFVSSSMDPQKLGYVDPVDGIRFTGLIAFSANGKLNFAGSRMKVEVWDEFALSGEEGAYTVQFNTMKAGSVAKNGAAQVVFEDAYGALSLKGTISGQIFYGTATFVNKRNFVSGTKPYSGTLGEFEVSACGFFNCKY